MIKGKFSIDGTEILKLKKYSKKKVTVICDSCGKENQRYWFVVLKTRRNRNSEMDLCRSCVASTPRLFKKTNGINPQRMDRKIHSGYVFLWSEEHKKHMLEHRLVLAKQMNKDPLLLKDVHHIDGVKTNNNFSNLIETINHSKIHRQLESLAFELVRKNIINFNRIEQKYYLNPDYYLNSLPISLDFDDISFIQKENKNTSRLSVDISSEIIRGIKVNYPIIPANMSTVINENLYLKIFEIGGFAVLHRAYKYNDYLSIIRNISKKCEWVAASIGIDNNAFNFSKKIIKIGVNVIFIDVAHGFSKSVFNLAKKIKSFSYKTKIVIGNTTNVDILNKCYPFVDAIKVGIAQGFVCETKNTAGCTEKQFSAVFKFKEAARNFGIPIISDGGIREPADFTKAIAAGANSIMAGKIFAACPESAAPIVNIDGIDKKLYAGMASRYVQDQWRGGLKPGTCPEGTVKYLDIGESVEKLIERYSGALRTGITYGGGTDIKSFQDNVEFIQLK